MSERIYSYLLPAFSAWFDRLFDTYHSTTLSRGIPTESLLGELNMNNAAFRKTYLEPWLHLSPDIISQILSILTKEIHHSSDTPVTFECNDTFRRQRSALQWLIVNLQELNVFPITPDLVYFDPLPMPYRQCRYCGRPYKDGRTKSKEKFNGRLKYCHTDECPGAASNPEMHVEAGCCYGFWARDKKALVQRLKNAQDKKEGEEIFLNFCQDNLQRNLLEVNYSIQTKSQPANEYQFQSQRTGHKLLREWLATETN